MLVDFTYTEGFYCLPVRIHTINCTWLHADSFSVFLAAYHLYSLNTRNYGRYSFYSSYVRIYSRHYIHNCSSLRTISTLLTCASVFFHLLRGFEHKKRDSRIKKYGLEMIIVSGVRNSFIIKLPYPYAKPSFSDYQQFSSSKVRIHVFC